MVSVSLGASSKQVVSSTITVILFFWLGVEVVGTGRGMMSNVSNQHNQGSVQPVPRKTQRTSCSHRVRLPDRDTASASSLGRCSLKNAVDDAYWCVFSFEIISQTKSRVASKTGTQALSSVWLSSKKATKHWEGSTFVFDRALFFSV